jgi:hypothetical protein
MKAGGAPLSIKKLKIQKKQKKSLFIPTLILEFCKKIIGGELWAS